MVSASKTGERDGIARATPLPCAPDIHRTTVYLSGRRRLHILYHGSTEMEEGAQPPLEHGWALPHHTTPPWTACRQGNALNHLDGGRAAVARHCLAAPPAIRWRALSRCSPPPCLLNYGTAPLHTRAECAFNTIGKPLHSHCLPASPPLWQCGGGDMGRRVPCLY